MAFLRSKTIIRNGKTYTYQYYQKSVREGDKVRSIHLGVARSELRLDEPAMLHDEYHDKFNAENPTPYTEALMAESEESAAEAPAEPDAAPCADAKGPAGGSDSGGDAAPDAGGDGNEGTA